VAEGKLWPKNKTIADDFRIPLIPRAFWLNARHHFENDFAVSAILMSGLAVESGINEYASMWMSRRFGMEQSSAMKFLEESMDFRKTVELLSFVGAIEEGLDSNLHSVYDSRNRYTHIQTSKILGKMADEVAELRDARGRVVVASTVKDEEVLRTHVVFANATLDARGILDKTEHCLAHLFETECWKQLLLNVAPRKANSEKGGVP